MPLTEAAFPRPLDDAPPPGNVERPCSLAQQRLWVLDRLDPGKAALNIAARWRIEGPISSADVNAAFEVIASRHEPLRTFFTDVDGEAMQVVQPSVRIPVSVADLTALREEAALDEAERIAHLEAFAPFDLGVAPAIRVRHVRLRSDLSILLVTTHQIVCDAWSLGVLAREMGEICAAFGEGRPPVLQELPVSHGEFLSGQRAWMSGASHDDCVSSVARETTFWRSACDGMEHFELPADFERSAARAAKPEIRSILLDRETAQGFNALSGRHDCTPFVTAVSVLTALLHRYTGETDIGIGTQVAGRHDRKLENLIGPCVNTLVLRIDLSRDPTFSELMARVRDVVSDAHAHETMPFELLLELLMPTCQAGPTPLFSVNFNVQSSFLKNAEYGGFRLIDLPSFSAGTIYDLDFSMIEGPEGWCVSCAFDALLFACETVDGLIAHFVKLLQSAVADSSIRVSELRILNGAERAQLVSDFTGPEGDYPRDVTLPELFRRQAATSPDAPAVVWRDRTVTYRELDMRAHALARALVQRGIGSGDRVGVFVERSSDLVAIPLGIMFAGCAYVPLDPGYPTERLGQLVEQSKLSAIVVHGGHVGNLPAGSVPLLEIDQLSFAASESDGSALPVSSPSDTAYVIFTSGSTGRPKAVPIRHQSLVNLLWAMRSNPGLAVEDTLVAVTTICFDIAALELFLPLIVGAKVVIADADQTMDGRVLLDLLRRHRATVMQATPATWRLLLEAGWDGDPGLKMLCGGEAMTRQLADRLLDRGTELWNMYGPTETTIWSSALRVSAGEGSVPLGGPIANTQFYVLDRQGELVPRGACGELCIGGDGVASGYWEMPEGTRERFDPDRFRRVPGARLYRTGDVVRVRRDGLLEFRGRSDQQVKIRGFRIELGEIEAVLLRHGDVDDAIAVVGKEPSGDDAIYAYAAPRFSGWARREVLADELRDRLAEALPGYMRPAALMVIEALPRLPNGKIDRKVLPTPDRHRAREVARGHVLSDIERRVAEIWAAVLGVQEIDQSADFFDLGGHSLLAVRLLARVEAEFGIRISVSALFSASNIGAFTRLIERSDKREFDFRQVVRLQPEGSKPALFAINNTGIYGTLSKRLGGDQPAMALQLFDPSFPRGSMPGSIKEIAEQYVQLIRGLQPAGPYALIGWCRGGVIAFEAARQMAEAGESISRLIVIDTWVPSYHRRLGSLNAVLAKYAYRWKLVERDWNEVRKGHRTIREFVVARTMFNRLLGRRSPDAALEPEYLSAERYDEWLLAYLERLLCAYEPEPFRGPMTVFRSAGEPAGRFLDSKMGWNEFATEGVELVVVPGDHFSIFRDPGVALMAKHISAALDGAQAGD